MKINFTPPLQGLKVISPTRFTDGRGYFEEIYNHRVLVELGITCEFVQDNHSYSNENGTVRGLHLQRGKNAQDKLVRCSLGSIFDVAVDCRRGSPTFGRWYGITLSLQNSLQLFIPKGFAHGFCTLENNSMVAYKCSNYYERSSEDSIRWDDPTLKIKWPLQADPIISDKDALAKPFIDFEPFQI